MTTPVVKTNVANKMIAPRQPIDTRKPRVRPAAARDAMVVLAFGFGLRLVATRKKKKPARTPRICQPRLASIATRIPSIAKATRRRRPEASGRPRTSSATEKASGVTM